MRQAASWRHDDFASSATHGKYGEMMVGDMRRHHLCEDYREALKSSILITAIFAKHTRCRFLIILSAATCRQRHCLSRATNSPPAFDACEYRPGDGSPVATVEVPTIPHRRDKIITMPACTSASAQKADIASMMIRMAAGISPSGLIAFRPRIDRRRGIGGAS